MKIESYIKIFFLIKFLIFILIFKNVFESRMNAYSAYNTVWSSGQRKQKKGQEVILSIPNRKQTSEPETSKLLEMNSNPVVGLNLH